MPDLQQAEQLKEFADEVFELSKEMWAAQSRSRSKPPAEISETEFLTLDILAKAGGPLNVGDIQKQIGVLPAQMSRVLRALEHKGDKPLIKCSLNAEDRRKIDVSLTAEGRKVHQSYRQVKLGSIQKMLEELNEHDRLELMRILRIIRQNVRKNMEDSRLDKSV